MLLVHKLALCLNPSHCFHLSPVIYDTLVSPQLVTATENINSELPTPWGVCSLGKKLQRANLGSSLSSVWLTQKGNPNT